MKDATQTTQIHTDKNLRKSVPSVVKKKYMTQQLLEKYLWDAATLLRGTIDAGDYKQYIFPLLF